MVYVLFLIHAIAEGGAAIADFVGLFGLVDWVPVFPWTKPGDATMAATAELGSLGLLAFGCIPYLAAFLTKPPPATCLGLAFGAVIYHLLIVSSTVFRLLDGDLPLFGCPEDADNGTRLAAGLLAAGIHLTMGWWFVAWIVTHSGEAEEGAASDLKSDRMVGKKEK
ncbi:hypothetical protein HK101_010376 [Irineochytrium annulatum]|nr:hypothetical protein HK101_010376 [Irineochytrium annulatum]